MILRRHAGWWVPWVCVGAVGAFALGLGAWTERHPPHQPITAEEEALYLEFAKAAREQLGDEYNWRALSFDPNYGSSRSAKEEAISERLLSMVPEYWPRRFLVVYLENECVVLSRGSGRLGQVGVRIYDRGPVAFRPQQRITDRVWFFTED